MGHKNALPTFLTFISTRNPIENSSSTLGVEPLKCDTHWACCMAVVHCVALHCII